MPAERVVLSDGAELATWTSSGPPGRAVVLLHGGAGMWDYLAPVADMVADLGPVHRYDQRGCGRSGPSTAYGTARFVADLEELRERFGHAGWTVVGHSFGAGLALSYAAAHPDRVDAVVCVSGVGLDWPESKPAYEAASQARRTPAQRARLAELSARERDAAEEVEWRTLSWLPDFPAPGAEAAARRLAEQPLPLNLACNAAFNAEHRARSGADERALCRRVTAAVLVVHGSADPRPVDGPRRLADALPDARLAVVDGAGHLPWLDRPDEVRALLRSALGA